MTGWDSLQNPNKNPTSSSSLKSDWVGKTDVWVCSARPWLNPALLHPCALLDDTRATECTGTVESGWVTEERNRVKNKWTTVLNDNIYIFIYYILSICIVLKMYSQPLSLVVLKICTSATIWEKKNNNNELFYGLSSQIRQQPRMFWWNQLQMCLPSQIVTFYISWHNIQYFGSLAWYHRTQHTLLHTVLVNV